jgi:ribonuclease D
LAVIARGVKVPAARQPRYPRERRPERTRAQEQRLKALKSWRERTAELLGVAGGVLVNNRTLEGLADLGPVSREELLGAPGLKGWQAEALGDAMLEVCRVAG